MRFGMGLKAHSRKEGYSAQKGIRDKTTGLLYCVGGEG